MKKTIQKFLTLIVVFSICFLTGCVDGLEKEDQLFKLIDGVYCKTVHNNQYFYEIETLTNNTMFDNEILFDSYSNLTLETKETCKIKGVVFVVRSLQNANLNFKVLVQDEVLLEKETVLNTDINQTVSMFFESSVLIDDVSKLKIEINQVFNENETIYEYAEFAFDSFLIFFEE